MLKPPATKPVPIWQVAQSVPLVGVVCVLSGWAESAIVIPMAVDDGRTISVVVWLILRNTEPPSWQAWQLAVMPVWPVGPMT